jgi:hypothetical protein
MKVPPARRGRSLFWSGILFSIGILVLSVVARASAADEPSWRQDKIWDDGKAEFAAYQVVWARYGSLYPGRAFLVLVKEPWAPEIEVKADRRRPDGFDVLKLVHARDVPTGVYTYHQRANVFFRRDTGVLRKIAASGVELCGISTARMVRGRLETQSYFDGQADRVTAYPEGALPEDGLPALLRDYVRGNLPPSLTVFPSLMAGRFSQLAPLGYAASRRSFPSLRVPAGTFAGVEIRLTREDRFLSYVFEDQPPFRLVRFEREDGTEYRLAKAERIAYWEMHRLGDGDWIPPGLR